MNVSNIFERGFVKKVVNYGINGAFLSLFKLLLFFGIYFKRSSLKG